MGKMNSACTCIYDKELTSDGSSVKIVGGLALTKICGNGLNNVDCP
jgi:hypothetical protein